jgi:hypothetical protein
MIANEKEFDESLQKLGELYEEGKQHLYHLQNGSQIMTQSEEDEHFDRLYSIIREMRDLGAVTMQKLHWKIEN